MSEWTEAQQALFERLDRLSITHQTRHHAPVFTVAEAQALRDDIPGAHTKNLFVRDKKGRYFLLVLEETAEVDLKQVHGLIGASGRVSFGKPDALMEYLGVEPGSVTSLAALNDREGVVTVVLDAALMKNDTINAHPLSNDATTSLSSADLIRYLQDCDHDPLILKLSS